MISVQRVTKRFGRAKALDEVSFSVNSGEVVGFLGPNGAGKTTMMRILTGFLSADRGSVLIDDIDVEKDPIAAQKKIGYLPESNPLYKNMQVAEFLDLSARLHQIPAGDRSSALDFAVESVGIGDVYYRPIGELSKGYRQRVGIAAALIHQPDIIVLDEPTEGLDPNQRTDMRRLIQELAKKHTVIVSTHVMQEASAISTRLLIINRGKIVADGTPDELSRASKKESMLTLEVEGDGIESALAAISSVSHSDVKQKDGKRMTLEISTQGGADIRPELSRLIWERKWIVWKLEEREYQLEEIFQALTKSGK